MTEPENTALGRSEPLGFFAELKRRKVFRVAAVYAVVGWLIIQVANATFADFGIPIWAYRFVVLMVVLGFPISLIITWAFELTPEGIKTTQSARAQQATTPAPPEHQKKRNWLAYAVGAAVPTVIFGVIAVIFYFTVRQPDAPEQSIAVLPFDNRSNNPEDAFFTDGIHDDLLTLISHIRDIKTISRTSVMGYRDTTKNMKTIGEELGVARILEGGVQRAGNQVRINVQLIDAATDAHLWALTYTRELTAENVFRIQSEIAGEIAESLQAILSPEEQKQLERLPTANLAALEAYFRGTALGYTADDAAEAIGHFQRAIELDPGFALAYAKLGQTHLYQIWLSGLSVGEQIAKAQPLIAKALELDPLLSEGYAALGLLRQYQEDLAGAEAAFERAIELNPNNALAYQFYGTLLARHLDNVEQGLVMQTKYEELDPETVDFKHVKAEYLFFLGRLDEGRAILENLVRDYPENAQFHRSLGMFYNWALGLYDQAIVELRQAHALDPENPFAVQMIAHTYERLGATEDEAFWLERTLAVAPEFEDELVSAFRNRIRLLIIKGELAEADALWWREWKRNQAGSSVLWELMNADFAVGRFEAPRARYFQAHPQWFETDATIPEDNSMGYVADVARSLMATGEQQQANYLLDQIVQKLAAIPARPITWFLRVYVPAIRGDEAATLRAIHAFVELSGAPVGNLYHEPMIGLLKSNPEIQDLFGEVVARRQEQLAHIRAMEAAGELAPIPPLPGEAER